MINLTTVEQEEKVVLMDAHLGPNKSEDNSVSDSTYVDQPANDVTNEADLAQQEDTDMAKGDEISETCPLATPDSLSADLPLHSEAFTDSLADRGQHPEMNATPPAEPAVNALTDATPHHDFHAANDEANKLHHHAAEVLNESQALAHKLLDSARERAATTVKESETQASRVVKSARERAITVLSAAQDRAAELITNTAEEARRIDDDAQTKAAEIAAEAITDSQTVVANGEERAREIIETASGTADDIIAGAEETAAEIKSASEAMRANAQSDAEQIRNEAREASRLMIADARRQVVPIEETQDSSITPLE